MDHEGAAGAATPPQPPGHFGPAAGDHTDKTADHMSGWHEPADLPEGARVPRLRPVAEHERHSLAERFRQRVREAAAEAGESEETR
jgi:hypothetical protein